MATVHETRGFYDFFAGDDAGVRFAGLCGVRTSAGAGVGLCVGVRTYDYFDCGFGKVVSAERTFEEGNVGGRFLVWQLPTIERRQSGLHYKIGITRGFLNAGADGR